MSVCGTDARRGRDLLRLFQEQVGQPGKLPAVPRHPFLPVPAAVYQAGRRRSINRTIHRLRLSASAKGRLTLRRRTLHRKPRACGGRDSHPAFRYSCRHSLLSAVHRSFRAGFTPQAMLPYHHAHRGRKQQEEWRCGRKPCARHRRPGVIPGPAGEKKRWQVRGFGGGLSPVNLRRRGAPPVSTYALLRGWPSGLPSGRHRSPTP